MNNIYENKQLREILNLTRSQIDHFTNQGLISGINFKTGTGVARKYDRINLFEFAIIKEIFNNGKDLSYVKEAFKPIKDIIFDFNPSQTQEERIKKIENLLEVRPYLVIYEKESAMLYSYFEMRSKFIENLKSKSLLLIDLKKVWDETYVIPLSSTI